MASSREEKGSDGADGYVEIIQEEGPDGTTSHKIGFSWAMKHLGNPPPQEYTRRGRRYKTVMSFFQDDFDPNKYRDEKISTGVTLCSLITRLLIISDEAWCSNKSIEEVMKKREMAEIKKNAADKRTVKMNMLRDRLGDEQFNAMKHRDQAASAKRMAENVTSDKIASFLAWRQTPAGLSYDTAPIVDVSTPMPRSAHSRCIDLGYTDYATMQIAVKKYLTKSGSLEIEWRPDPADSSTTLYQYTLTLDHGILQMRNVDHFSAIGKTFAVTGYKERDGRTFVAIGKKSSAYRILPKEWRSFEAWSGYGIVGNPKESSRFDLMIELVPTNIAKITFVIDKVKYTLSQTHNASRVQDIDSIDAKIINKYQLAEKLAKESAEAERLMRAAEARRRGIAQARSRIAAKNKHDEEKTTESSDALRNLALRLANGDITPDTFDKASKALMNT